MKQVQGGLFLFYSVCTVLKGSRSNFSWFVLLCEPCFVFFCSGQQLNVRALASKQFVVGGRVAVSTFDSTREVGVHAMDV